MHRFIFGNRIGWIVDDAILRRQPAQHFDFGTPVTAHRDYLEVSMILRIDGHNAQSLRTKEHRVDRNNQCRVGHRKLQMDLRIRAR